MSETCSTRIQIVKIIQPLVGASGPFLGRDQSGIHWAVKPELVEPKPHERYLLFSEFLMASIANQMGLSWPEAKVAIWDPSLRAPALRGVALRWHPGLNPVFSPIERKTGAPVPVTCSDLLAAEDAYDAACRARLTPLLNEKNLSQLAGFTVLSRWADGQDPKEDVLQLDGSDNFVFLDGGHYFGNQVGEQLGDIAPAYQRGQAFGGFGFTSVLEGQPVEVFRPWLDRLAEMRHTFEAALQMMPPEWLPPPGHLDHLREEMFGRIFDFIAYFEGAVNDKSGASAW